MKGQKGGRVSMPFEYFNASVKGPFTSNPAPATLARGMVDPSGCTMGPLQIGGKRKRNKKESKRRRSKNSKNSRQSRNSKKNNHVGGRKRSARGGGSGCGRRY